jgi:hypothetical protein
LCGYPLVVQRMIGVERMRLQHVFNLGERSVLGIRRARLPLRGRVCRIDGRVMGLAVRRRFGVTRGHVGVEAMPGGWWWMVRAMEVRHAGKAP